MESPLGNRASTEAGFVAVVAALVVVGASVATVALWLGEDPDSADQSQLAFDFAATPGVDPGPQDCNGLFGDVDGGGGNSPDGVLNVTYVGAEPIPVERVIMSEPGEPNRALQTCSGLDTTELTTNTSFVLEVNADDILYFNRTDETGVPVGTLGRWERTGNLSAGNVTITDAPTETGPVTESGPVTEAPTNQTVTATPSGPTETPGVTVTTANTS